MPAAVLPEWAQEMRAVFKAEAVSQFVLYGNIRDLVEHRNGDGTVFLPLREYLSDVLFEPFDVVLCYDLGRGIRVARGTELFFKFLQGFDAFHGSRFASDAGIGRDPGRVLESPGLLPRAPEQALELINRFMAAVIANTRLPAEVKAARSLAVIIDYAHFVVPAGESIYLTGAVGGNLIRILNWAEDPAVTAANITTVLLTENLLDLNAALRESPFSAKIPLPLPDAAAISRFVQELAEKETNLPELCEIPLAALGEKLLGLSRIRIKNLILRAARAGQPLTQKYLVQVRKEAIEKEAAGKLEFLESRRTLDDVSGHTAAKAWLREDAALLKKAASTALPMGYLITGRIGTGKTFLVECFAGECGVPFVALKNFREKWVGATEGNLEKIFTILHALGQVVVFVDEADQAAGRRESGEGDSGLSGRIYAMLAKEMSDTRNRGKILWIFATSRPDLVEVDLKRQGRLDVHIPLFPPEDEVEKREFFLAMARKLKLTLNADDIPPLPFREGLGGNEIEGLLVRAVRRFELQGEENRRSLVEILREEIAGFRPSAHTARLELMDLLAVKECTDERFLPERFRRLTGNEVEARIRALLLKT